MTPTPTLMMVLAWRLKELHSERCSSKKLMKEALLLHPPPSSSLYRSHSLPQANY